MTRCSDCKRRLNKPALTIGAYSYGPVCAQRYIIRPARAPRVVPVRAPRARAVVDESQLALEFA